MQVRAPPSPPLLPGDGGADDELEPEPLVSPLDEVCSDELLTPLERMEKYHNSEELLDRSETGGTCFQSRNCGISASFLQIPLLHIPYALP